MNTLNDISFELFKDKEELKRWVSFNKVYYGRENSHETTVDNGYKNPKEHANEIRELMETILDRHTKYFKIRQLSNRAKPDSRLSFAARMRYATKYLLSTGLISIHHKTKGSTPITYKCNVDLDTFEEILDTMNKYDVW